MSSQFFFFVFMPVSSDGGGKIRGEGKEAARSATEMLDKTPRQRLRGGFILWRNHCIASSEFPAGQESNWDVKHRSSSTLGLMDGNVFTVCCDLVFWKGEFSSLKAQVETFISFWHAPSVQDDSCDSGLTRLNTTTTVGRKQQKVRRNKPATRVETLVTCNLARELKD